MAVILHVLKKDLRITWISLCVVFAFLILQLFVTQKLESPSSENFTSMQVWLFTLLLFLYLFIIGTSVQLIHADPLTGTSGFWMTRPISGNSLFLAKGLFIFLFLVFVPVVVDFILLFHFGMKSSHAFPIMFKMITTHLGIVCVSVCLAAITASRKYFFLAVTLMLYCTLFTYNQLGVTDWQKGWINGFTILVPLLLSVTIGVSAHQFLTRKTKRSIVLLTAGFALVWLSCLFVIWARHPFKTQGSLETALSINFVPDKRASAGIKPVPVNPLNHSLSALPVLQGITAPEEIMLTHIRGQLDLQNGEVISYTSRDDRFNYGMNAVQQALLPGFQLIGPLLPDSMVELLSVPENKYQELYDRRGTYTGEAQFSVYRDTILSEVPLVKGARINSGLYRISIVNVTFERTTNLLVVSLEYEGLKINSDRNDEFFFCVLNRERSQMIPQTLFVWSGPIQLPMLPGIDLMHWGSKCQYYAPKEATGSSVPIMDDAWLADAHFVVIHRDYVAQISKKFQIQNFRMADYTIN